MARTLTGTGLMMCAALLGFEAASTQEPSAGSVGEPPRLALRVETAAQPFGVLDKAIPGGAVVTNPAGERRVIVSGRHHPEIWKIGDDGEVLDTGHFVPTGVAGRVRVEWEKSAPAEWGALAVGVMPWKATGERFAAFRLTDWLVARANATGLPYFGRDAVAFRFGASGVLEATLEDGGKVAGRWWWSRGRLHLEIEGLKDVATYEWRALAARVGWTEDMEAPALVGPAVRPLASARGRTPPRSLPGAAAACPREVLARLLGSAAERGDVVSALAIEKETLGLCAERQALVVEIAKMERLLGKVAKKDREGETQEKPARSVSQLATVAAAKPPPPPRKATAPPPAVRPAEAPDTVAAPVPEGNGSENPSPPAPARGYSWFSLLGMPGRMLAGVTDGSRSWFVAVGDELPGGAKVERISGKPPGVRVAGLGLLPWTGHSPVAAAAAGVRSGADPASGPGAETLGASSPETSAAAQAAPAALAGKARAVDGDTLEIGGTRVRLWGIDAPESRQTCRAEGREWNCGGLAAAALRSRSTDVRCEPRGTDRYGRVLAVCFEGAEDINAWLVSEGWALAYRRYSKAYVAFEEEARGKGRGMHRGAFVPPWEWRRGRRLEPAADKKREGGDARDAGMRELPPLPGSAR